MSLWHDVFLLPSFYLTLCINLDGSFMESGSKAAQATCSSSAEFTISFKAIHLLSAVVKKCNLGMWPPWQSNRLANQTTFGGPVSVLLEELTLLHITIRAHFPLIWAIPWTETWGSFVMRVLTGKQTDGQTDRHFLLCGPKQLWKSPLVWATLSTTKRYSDNEEMHFPPHSTAGLIRFP